MDAATVTGTTWQGGRGAPAGWPSASGGAAGAAERLLHDAAARAARFPQGRVALVVHLSRLHPPAPQPYHVRVARALLADAAGRRDGHLFALGNRDLVLLCAAGGEVLALPALLRRLLCRDAPDPAALVSLWDLQADAAALLAYAAARLVDPAGPVAAPPAGPVTPLALERVAAMLRGAGIDGLMRRQTAALLAPPGAGTAPLRPLFHEVAPSPAALAAVAEEAAPLVADPCLSQPFAARLDAMLLDWLGAALGGGGPADAARRGLPPLHLNLTLPTLRGAAFADLARRCRAAGARLGVEVRLQDAAADPAGFRAARQAAAALGCAVALDGVSHLALLVARPWELPADLIKLDWSPALAHLPAEEQAALGAALRAAGPARIVLSGAGDEAALRWGGAQGIRRFQGPQVEALLAAARRLSCPAGRGCTRAQCAARATASDAAGRAPCRRPDLLDAAAAGALAA